MSADYVHDKLNVPYSFVVELRDRGAKGFLLPPDQIEDTAEEAFAGIMAGITCIDKT